MQHYYNSYCELTSNDIAEPLAPLSVPYCNSVAAIHRELTNPQSSRLILSRSNKKWMANISLSMLQFPFIHIKLNSVGNEVQHSTHDLTYCIDASKSIIKLSA